MCGREALVVQIQFRVGFGVHFKKRGHRSQLMTMHSASGGTCAEDDGQELGRIPKEGLKSILPGSNQNPKKVCVSVFDALLSKLEDVY